MIRKAKFKDVSEIIKLCINTTPRKNFHVFLEMFFVKLYVLLNSIYVYEIDDEIVGCVWLALTFKRLGHLYVLPKYQRKGIGSKLLAHAESKYKHTRNLNIYAHKNVISFYLNRGYEYPDIVRLKKQLGGNSK